MVLPWSPKDGPQASSVKDIYPPADFAGFLLSVIDIDCRRYDNRIIYSRSLIRWLKELLDHKIYVGKHLQLFQFFFSTSFFESPFRKMFLPRLVNSSKDASAWPSKQTVSCWASLITITLLFSLQIRSPNFVEAVGHTLHDICCGTDNFQIICKVWVR